MGLPISAVYSLCVVVKLWRHLANRLIASYQQLTNGFHFGQRFFWQCQSQVWIKEEGAANGLHSGSASPKSG